MELISVIVPAYNAEKTIDRCIDSIENQTYDNLEIIIIDDGSVDNTKKSIRKRVVKDKRIRCISQANAGAAQARANGLNAAHGQYVAFIDSDDYISSDLIFRLVEGINKSKSDMAISTLITSAQPYPFKDKKPKLIKKQDFSSCFRDLYLAYTLNSLCGNLYRMKIAKQCSFNTALRVGEDLTFNFQYIEKCNSVYLIPYRGYHYVANVFSSTHKYNRKDFVQQEKIRKIAIEFCHKMGIKNYSEAVDAMYLRNVLDGIVNTVTYAPSKEAYNFIKDFRESKLFNALINKYPILQLGMDRKRNIMMDLYYKKFFAAMVILGKINYLRNDVKKQKATMSYER